jgi:CheY-like chemotaxis protein
MARILLVEDEIPVLILAESVVQGLGHSTYSAGSVTQAAALLDDPGEIQLLFTDIRLPESELGGFELAEQARAKNPDLKVLYTTGDTVTDGMKVMFVEGGEMLLKPYTAPELAAAIARLLPESGG